MEIFTHSLAHRLRVAYLRMHRVTNRILRPYGVTADQYVLLRLLIEDDGMTQQELASQCGSDPTTVGRMLDLLEGKDLVERRPHASDRRAWLLFLTESGRSTIEQLYEIALPVRQSMESTMSESTLKSMMRGLAQLSDGLDALENEAMQPVTAGVT